MINKSFIANGKSLTVLQASEGSVLFTDVINEKFDQNTLAMKNVNYKEKQSSHVL
jgi:hypothetical protein